jgi:hypothetical protein
MVSARVASSKMSCPLTQARWWRRPLEIRCAHVGPGHRVGIEDERRRALVREYLHPAFNHGNLGTVLSTIDAELRPHRLDDSGADVDPERTVGIVCYGEERLAVQQIDVAPMRRQPDSHARSSIHGDGRAVVEMNDPALTDAADVVGGSQVREK